MTPLWFWELPKRDMGVWAPVYSGFPKYNGVFFWPQAEGPIAWVRIA